MKLRLPNTYVLLFALLALIALLTWLVPAGRFDTQLVEGKSSSSPAPFSGWRPSRRVWWR